MTDQNKHQTTAADLRKSDRVLEQRDQLKQVLDTNNGETTFPCEFIASGAGKAAIES